MDSGCLEEENKVDLCHEEDAGYRHQAEQERVVADLYIAILSFIAVPEDRLYHRQVTEPSDEDYTSYKTDKL